MKRPKRTLFLILIISLLLCSCTDDKISHTQAKVTPNIIIILADDMGFGDISFNNPHSRTETPNIDKLAKSGIHFSDAHAAGAVCIPSRYGLLTGRYFFRAPKHFDHLGYLSPLIEKGRETIGSLMQKAGYTTACVGKWHLGLDWGLKDSSESLTPQYEDAFLTNIDYSKIVKSSPNNLGFDYSFILPASLDMPPYVFVENSKVIDPNIILTADAYPLKLEQTENDWDRKYTNENDIYWDRGVWWRNGEMSKSFKFEECLDQIVDHGISFIEEQVRTAPEKPFLLYMALTGPHTPWLPNNQFKGSSEMGTYGDFVNEIDDVVLQVNQKLKELGIDDNTMVIFSSDNGSPWAEEDIQHYSHQSNWGRRGQKGDLWDGGHRVPLFISWPSKITKPKDYDYSVDLIDLMSTFAEMTGQELEESDGEDSFSFYPVINGNTTQPTRDHVIYISSSGKLAIKRGDWKLIDCLGSGGFSAPSVIAPKSHGPEGQLYDLNKDSLESVNLYLQYPNKVSELSNLMHQVIASGRSRSRSK